MAKKIPINYTRSWLCEINDLTRFVQTVDGVSSDDVKQLHYQLADAGGTPQAPRDWKDPKQWIPHMTTDGVLTASTSALAQSIADAGLNPKWFNFDYMRVCLSHGFLEEKAGILKLTDAGRRFVHGDSATIDQFLYEEGCIALLGIIHDNNGAITEEILPWWQEWLNKEAGSKAQARSVLIDSLRTRMRYVLIPLGLVRQEGIPRRYFITDKGVEKYEGWMIDTQPDKEKTLHTIAIDNLIQVGACLGYQVKKEPSLKELMPKPKAVTLKGKVFNKHLDAVWTTNLPLVGEIRIAAEVQAKGSIPDLLSRLKIVAPYCHYMVVVSDEHQIEEIRDFIVAQGDEKVFGGKMIYLTFDDVAKIRTQATSISSKLRPTFGEEVEETEEEEPTE